LIKFAGFSYCGYTWRPRRHESIHQIEEELLALFISAPQEYRYLIETAAQAAVQYIHHRNDMAVVQLAVLERQLAELVPGGQSMDDDPPGSKWLFRLLETVYAVYRGHELRYVRQVGILRHWRFEKANPPGRHPEKAYNPFRSEEAEIESSLDEAF
jgi:hypothetical protein